MNPLDDQAAYGTMTCGGVRAPGTLVDVDGADRPYAWDKQKPVNKGGASTVFKGQEVADTIKTVHHLTTASDFVDLATFRKAVSPQTKGEKPPALDVSNAIFTNNGIKSISLKKFGQEKHLGGGLWAVTIEWTEFAPPEPAAVGANAASKTSASGKAAQPTAADEATRQIEALLKQARAA